MVDRGKGHSVEIKEIRKDIEYVGQGMGTKEVVPKKGIAYSTK